MTDIEKKAYEIYPINNSLNTYFGNEKIDYNAERREGYIKCAEEYESLPKIHGWVARDEDGELNVFFYEDDKPFRESDILSFINSLQQEQPEVCLEEEITRFFNQLAIDESLQDGVSISKFDLVRTARHFYKLGLNARKKE